MRALPHAEPCPQGLSKAKQSNGASRNNAERAKQIAQNLLPAHVFSNSRLSQSVRPKDSEPHHVPVCVFFAWAVIMQSFPYWSINVSLDLIEIALSRLTDFAEFERLATEVMYLDGWHDIKPLGGVSDQGQDAISESFFQAELERTVFQYTLQEYLPGKVAETIEKLKT